MANKRQWNSDYRGNRGRRPSGQNGRGMSSYLRSVQREKEEQNGFLKNLVLLTIVCASILMGIFLFADNEEFLIEHFGQDSFITKAFQKVTRGNSHKMSEDFSLPFGPKRQNILFLGVDDSGNPDEPWNGTRTDTILLMNIDPRSKSVNAISIPRDSKVYLPRNNGVNKINSAHAIGGIDMTIETIEDTFGVRIDKYIMVHDNAVKNIVDAMDGIDIYVEKPMNYDDYAGKLHIHFDKGHQHLNGKQAVEYLRFRHDALGDIGRTQRQQWFMRGLLNTLKKPDIITKIPDIVSVAKKYIKTNMSLYEMSQYAALVRHLDMDKIEIATLPGAPNEHGYISYWILDPELTQQTINRLIYREKQNIASDAKLKASVMYSQSRKIDSENLVEKLKEQGINVNCTGAMARTHSQFIVHSKRVSNEYYVGLKSKLPELSGMQFVYDPMNYYCAESDFTIILTGSN